MVDVKLDGNARIRVFLSYSRKDQELVARLAEGIISQGFLVDFDRSNLDPDNIETGIAASDEWWIRLQEMIALADVIVFAVSPASAASEICNEELAYARSLSKRVIAVLLRHIDFAKAPPRLSALNVKIDFTDAGPGFEAALADLARSLSVHPRKER